jgi:hypothetical protein
MRLARDPQSDRGTRIAGRLDNGERIAHDSVRAGA